MNPIPFLLLPAAAALLFTQTHSFPFSTLRYGGKLQEIRYDEMISLRLEWMDSVM